MMQSVPLTTSWPARRPAKAQGQPCCADKRQQEDEQLSHQQLQAWVQCLSCGQLVIPADSLQLLPAQLPYELMGPCILAAVDSLAAACSADSSTAPSCKQRQQQQQMGLVLYGVDVQEPMASPLLTCFTAYPSLQQLSLQELNIDAPAAVVLATMVQPASSHLVSISMRAVFMCELAWQALAKGLAAGCQLQTLSLQQCLNITTLGLLATALPAGCSNLQQLDLSNNTLMAPHASSSHAGANSSADRAWALFLDALALPCCPQLQDLQLRGSSLGPEAAAALAQLLRTKGRSNLQQLAVAQCAGMGEASTMQLMLAAGSHPSLHVLDLSSIGLSDPSLRCLTGQQACKWPWKQQACQQLQELHLAGNSLLTGAGVAQLAKQLAAGSLSMLRVLDLANCPGVGEEGATSLAACLSSSCCQLEVLDLSGCEVPDQGVAALAAAVCSSGLKELRLADNQITAAGMQHLATAVQHPSCRLGLLDVSFNWAGPEAVKPLVQAAEALAAGKTELTATTDCSQQGNQQQHIVREVQQQHETVQGSSLTGRQHNNGPRLIVLGECSHDMWRVEAAKAAARAAAAADAAALAAAEAAAAAAAAGSSWDPHGSDQLSLHQHPAAATAMGFANSSCEGCGSSSMRTHAGSPIGFSPLSGRTQRSCRSAVWLCNGLYCQPDETSSPGSQGEAEGLQDEAAGNTAAARQVLGTARRLFPTNTFNDGPSSRDSNGVHDAQLSVSHGTCLPGRSSSVDSTMSSRGSLEAVADPGLLETGIAVAGAADGSSRSAEEVDGSRASSPAAAADGVADPWGSAALAAPAPMLLAGAAGDATDGTPAGGCDLEAPGAPSYDGLACSTGSSSHCSTGSSSHCSCIQQEVSFRYQFHDDDVVHSPTRYDQQQQQQQQQQQARLLGSPQQQQQQQQQQLKGLLGSQEFTLSPPNPLYFSSSPLNSPVPHCKLPGRAAAASNISDVELLLLPPGANEAASDCRQAAEDVDEPGAAAGRSAAAVYGDPTGADGAAGAQPPHACEQATQGQPSSCTAGQHSCVNSTGQVLHRPRSSIPAVAPVEASAAELMPPAAAAAITAEQTAGAAAAVLLPAAGGAAASGCGVQALPQSLQRSVQPCRANSCLAVGPSVRAVTRLRQPYSPDRQLSAPTIRALPPGSPRRRCGLFATPSPPSAAAVEAAAAAVVSTCQLRPQQEVVPAAAPVAAAGSPQAPGGQTGWGAVLQVQEVVLCSPGPGAAAACSAGSTGSGCGCGSVSSSIGSSRSSLGSVSTSRQVRHRVGSGACHLGTRDCSVQRQHQQLHEEQQHEEQEHAPADDCCSHDTLVFVQAPGSRRPQCDAVGVAAVDVLDRGSPPSGLRGSGAAVCKQQVWLRQQPARQLFRELQHLQHCEVVAMASSGSYLQLLGGGSGVGAGIAGAEPCMRVLPQVSG